MVGLNPSIYLCLFILLNLPTILFAKGNNAVDIVVFSYDRPIQLYACLESMKHYFTGIHQIQVIYRTSGEPYEEAYAALKKAFPDIAFHKQIMTPENNFKQLVLHSAFKQSTSEYVMFAVDDIIVTDSVNLFNCVDALEKYRALGFFLRLGKNITYCYIQDTPNPNPHGKAISPNLFLWQFSRAVKDWANASSLDMTIYRKKDIKHPFTRLSYNSPNTLESLWWRKWKKPQRLGVCFSHSKIINMSINLVNTQFNNRHSNTFSTHELLKQFQDGRKINIAEFYRARNNSVHVEYRPHFIAR